MQEHIGKFMKSLHKKGINMTLIDINKYITLKFKNGKKEQVNYRQMMAS